MSHQLQHRAGVLEAYPDVYTPEAVAALAALAHLETDRRQVMAARSARRLARAREGRRIEFLEGNSNQGDALCFEPVAGAPDRCN